MLRQRRRPAAAALAAGGLGLLALALPLVPGAAQEVVAFAARSEAKGIQPTGGVRPMAIDPLLHPSVAFSRTALSSVPSSAALAAVLYPGDLPYAVLKPESTVWRQVPPASPLAWRAAEASYPDRPTHTQEFGSLPTDASGLTVAAGRMEAEARPDLTRTRTRAAAVVLSLPSLPVPLAEVSELETLTEARKTSRSVTQTARFSASGVRLLGGAITIDRLTASARALSAPGSDPVAEADVRVLDARVTDTSGRSWRAVIDRTGIRVDDPSSSRSVNQALTQQLQASLGRLGIEVRSMELAPLADDPIADASATALSVVFVGGCEACAALPPPPPDDPTAVVPRDVRCVLTRANAALPCLTLALVPSPTSTVAGSVLIGSVHAVAAATSLPPFEEPEPGPGGGTGGGTTLGDAGPPPAAVLGGEEAFFAPAAGMPAGSAPAVPARLAAGRGGFAGPRTVLVKRGEMPDWALAAGGALLLAVALGMGLVPSLRRGAS